MSVSTGPYAIVTWKYDAPYNMTIGKKVTAGMWKEVKLDAETISWTYWAKCPESETDDQTLGRWIKEIATPYAEELVKNKIITSDIQNEAQLADWEEKQARQGRNPNGRCRNARPRRKVYAEYQAERLIFGTPWCQMELPPPDNDINRERISEVPWLSNNGVIHKLIGSRSTEFLGQDEGRVLRRSASR